MCKRILFYVTLLCLFASVAYSAMTYSVKSSPTGDWWSGQTPEFDPAWAWAKEVEDRIEFVTATGAFYFDPTDTAPTASEGMLYYNETGETLHLRVSNAWRALDLAGASSLNTAYGIGKKIDADTGVVEIEVADGSNNIALLIDHDENTSNNNAVHITNAGAGIALDIDGTDGYDIEGTAAAFRVNYTGALECVGITSSAGDVLFDDTYDLSWDTDRDQLLFEDNAILGIGGAHDAAADVTFKWDATNLVIEAAVQDDGVVTFGATNSMDWLFYDNAATGTANFNSGNATLELNAYDLQLQDGDFLMFGDDDDWTIDSSTTLILDIVPNTTDESSTVYLGADAAGADLKLFAATSGDYWLWDSGNEEWLGIGVDIQVDDDSIVRFGTAGDGDVTMQWDGTSFEIFAAKIDSPMLIGGTTYGFDITYYFETAGTIDIDYDGDAMGISDDMLLVFGTNDDVTLTYDETTDDNFEITAASVGMSITTNDFIATLDGAAANQFKVDATGTVAGDAIVLETTSGGIQFLADGAGTGDITLDAEGLVSIVSAEAAADQFKVDAQGTVAGIAIQLETTSGAIKFLADGSGTGDILLDAEGLISVIAAEGAANQFKVDAQGTVAGNAIVLETTEGGIQLLCDGDTEGDIDIDAEDIITITSASATANAVLVTAVTDLKVAAALVLNDAEAFAASDTTPAVTGASFYTTDASTQTLTDFDGTIDTGHIIYIESTAAVTYDTDGTPGNLTGSSANIVTADGDLTGWIYNGTDWLCFLFMDVSADNSGGI